MFFGVLENKNGIINGKEEMLKWLMPNYNIYIVYQKKILENYMNIQL